MVELSNEAESTVLAEFPGYDPLAGAARFLGANVRMFDRKWRDGWKIGLCGHYWPHALNMTPLPSQRWPRSSHARAGAP